MNGSLKYIHTWNLVVYVFIFYPDSNVLCTSLQHLKQKSNWMIQRKVPFLKGKQESLQRSRTNTQTYMHSHKHNQHTPKNMWHVPDVLVMELAATESCNLFAAIFKLWLWHTLPSMHTHTPDLADHEKLMRELKHMRAKTIETHPWLSSYIHMKTLIDQSA